MVTSKEKIFKNRSEIFFKSMIKVQWWCGSLVTKPCLTLAMPGTVALQALLSLGFPRQEYSSVLPFPPPGDFPNPGIVSVLLMSPTVLGSLFTSSATKSQ